MKISGTGIPPVSGPGNALPPEKGGRSPVTGDNAGLSGDGVEISAVSRGLAALSAMNDVREELVAQILAQLDAGEYLDSDKLQAAVLKMLNGL